MRDVVERLDALCDAVPFHASWYLKDIATGARADRLGDVPVPSASTRKISIMMAALAAVHAGKLSLDQKITLDRRFQDNDSGTFQHLTPGFWLTLRDAMVMMIIVSDNTCTGHVVDLVGLANVQRYTEAIGLTGTVHRCDNDAGIIFKGDRPLCILTAYTVGVPDAVTDGTPGFSAAYQLIGRIAKLSYDELGGR